MALMGYGSSSGGGGGGTVTGVTASTPLASSGGTTPNITLADPVPVSLGGGGASNAITSITSTSANPLALPATNTVIWNSASIVSCTSIVAPTEARRITFRVIGSPVLFVNQSSGATAANRFDLPGSQNLTCTTGQAVTFFYNTVSSRWNLVDSRIIASSFGSGSQDSIYSIGAGTSVSLNNSVLLGTGAASINNIVLGQSVVIGNDAGRSMGTSSYQTIIGNSAGKTITGNSNTLIGYNVSPVATSTTHSAFVGYQAALALTTGIDNCGIGSECFPNLTTGSSNTALGDLAGGGLTTGSSNIFLGRNTTVSSGSISNSLVIGSSVQGTQSNTASILGYFYTGIGKTNAAYKLDVAGDINTDNDYRVGGVLLAPWRQTGNALTSGEKFGSTNFKDVLFYTNNVNIGRMSKDGLWGFSKTAPTAAVHIGVKTGSVGDTSNLVVSSVLSAAGFAFGSGNKNFENYGTIDVDGTTIFSTTPATAFFSEPFTSEYDPTGATCFQQDGTGYDPNVDTPPSYEIWAIYQSGAFKNISSTSTSIGSWGSTNPSEVNVSWTAPTATEAPTSYFIVRNATDNQTTTNTNITDQNSGWTAGTTVPGTTLSNYDVNLSWTAGSNTTGYRTLDTTNGTFDDSATESTTADGTWASGSTVTPTSADYVSLKVDGDTVLDTSLTGILQATSGVVSALSPFTAGSIVFSNGTTLAQDNASLFFDDTNNRLGVGTATPSAKIHAVATTEQQRLGYDASNYLSTTVSSTGAVTLDAVGSGSKFTLSDTLTLPNGTAGAPSINFASDLTTGFFRSTTNTIGIAVNGSQVGSIDAISSNIRIYASQPIIQGTGGSVKIEQSTLTSGTNNSYDLGSTGVRWRSLFFGTSVNGPLVVGGTGTTSTLTLQPTTGVGTTNADIIFKVGNNGATESFRVLNAGTIQIADAINISTNTTTGTKIGTATTQKIGLWNATPVVQPTTGVTAAAFVANTSGIVDDSATFGGYTIGQIVAALKQIGALA